MAARKIGASWIEAALGVGALAVVALAALLLPSFGDLELLSLNLRFQFGPQPPPMTEIVHVDIDDYSVSISRMGRWPWDRNKHARFVDMATLLGARQVLFDVEFSEPQTPFLPTKGAERVEERVKEHTEAHAEMLKDILKDPTQSNTVQLAILAQKEEKFPLDVKQIIDEEVLDYDRAFAKSMRQNGRVIIGFNADSAKEDNRVGNEIPEFLPRLPERAALGPAGPAAPVTRYVTPPIAILGEAVGDMGMTTIEPDNDGVNRRVALLWNYKGMLYPQLGFRMVLNHYGIPKERVSIEPGRIRAGDFVIPTDRNGRVLIRWRAGPRGEMWNGMFPHQSYYNVYLLWQYMDDLDTLFAGLAELWPRKTLFAKRNALRGELKDALDRAAGEELEKRTANFTRLMKEIRDEEKNLVKSIVEQAAERRKTAAEEERERLDRVDGKLNEIREGIELARELETTLRSGPAALPGKIWIVGAAFAAMTDFHSIPMRPSEKVPGVCIHSNLFNMIANRRFLSTTAPWVAYALMALFGVVGMFLAMRLNALTGSLTQGGVVAGYAGLCVLLFARGTWFPFVGPALAAVLPYVSVTIYRAFTEEREKKEVRKLFEHYVDPNVVKQLLADPASIGLGGAEREGTILFADVAGFTKYSFVAKPEEAVTFVNRYLSMGSEMIIRHGGYLDKYMGDGIMAVFGAPVVQTGQTVQACLTALEIQSGGGLDWSDFEKKVGLPFRIRIGLATGMFVVGNVGSRERVSYTAVGDVVNLASRLQTAGKELGATLLCNEETARQAGDAVETRDLGIFMVRGRDAAVRVHEILGRKGEVPPDKQEFVKWFDEGLRAYFDRRWDEATGIFLKARELVPDDKATAMYLMLLEKYREHPPETLGPIPV